MRIFIVLAVLLTMAGYSAGAESHNNFSGYVRILLEKHPELKALKYETESKDKVPSQEYSLPNPQLTLGVMDLPADTFSFSGEDMTRKVIGLTQSFPAPGKRDLRRKIAEEDAEGSRAMVGEKRLELVEQARIAFYNLAYLLKSRETTVKNKNILHDFIEVALARYSTGQGVQQDVLAAQIEYSRMTENLIGLEKDIAVVSSNLNVWAGLPSDTKWDNPEIDPLPSVDADADRLLEKAVETRPMFRQLDAALRKSGAMTGLARKELLPDYSVGVSYGIRENGAMPRSNLVSAEVMIELPIYRSTRQNQMISQAALMEDKARLDIESEKLKMRRDISEMLEMQKRDERLLSLYDTGLLPQARQSVAASVSAYRVNKVDFRWLVMNQATLFEYELMRYRMEYELLSTRARLTRMLGRDEFEVNNEN
jgi:outer membrane protein TolC